MAMRAHGLVGPWPRFVGHHWELGRAGLGKRRCSAEARAWAAAVCWPVDPAARRGRAVPVVACLTGLIRKWTEINTNCDLHPRILSISGHMMCHGDEICTGKERGTPKT